MWWTLSVALAQPVLIDRVLADVAGELVLASDAARLVALHDHDPLASPFWSTEWGPERDRLIDAAAIRTIAANVGIYTPTQQAVKQRLDAMRATFAAPAAFAAVLVQLDLTEPDMLEHVRHRVLIDGYLSRNLQASPSDRAVWLAEAQAHVAGLKRRLRIRSVPPLDP